MYSSIFTMFTFTLPLFSFLLLFTTTAAVPASGGQPYKATEHFVLDCGSSSTTTVSDRRWDADERSKFTPANIATTSFSSKPSHQDPSVPETPYSTARIFNTSSFTYTFPVSEGPKFLRLYLYPATYSDLNANQSFFSVSSNGYYLLTNFSPFLAASYVGRTLSDAGVSHAPAVPHLVKEFIVYVKDTQTLDVIFTPESNSYAFINGIEIVSMPEDLYYKQNSLKYIGISDDMAQETVYRLNVGGGYISGDADTGMYRSWEPDDKYIFGKDFGFNYVNTTPITYTRETPNYTAPEQVYATQRSTGNLSELQNMTWTLPVDSGFHYKLRLHFCNIKSQNTNRSSMGFRIFIYNQTAEKAADPFYQTRGSEYPVFKDYGVFVADPDGSHSKQNLWLAMHPNDGASDDGYLNGLEAFKLSISGNLSSPNPDQLNLAPESSTPMKRNTKRTPRYVATIGGVCGGLALLFVFFVIVFRLWKRVKHYDTEDKRSWGLTSIELRSTENLHSALSSSDRCRRFTLKEVKVSTREFNDNCVIGRGGFGKVYKGYIDNAKTTVAIKRLNPSSNQGFHEFQTEIKMLSKLRHAHLVSLIGFCDEDGEMVLVYDYMAHGTLQEHLYKTENPPLPWKTRLHICIGAAQGLLYLHTSAKRGIIHRDVKSTNILLDENWVAKVSDFGLSKLGPKGESDTHVTTLVKGSAGYLDPEYYRRQQLTDKSDVYSFGVVLFEVLCARPVIIPWLPNEQVNLAEWGNDCYRNGTLDEIIDPKLRGEIAPGSLRKFGEVASSCLKEQGSKRPAMDAVVCGLEFALMLQEAAEKRDAEEHTTMEGKR